MSASIPYSEETFRPICVKGNKEAGNPVEFEICAVGGSSRARLKSILVATGGLAQTGDWSPSVQEAVVKAFETGPGVFVEGITAVRNLTAPARLCQRVGLIAEIPKGLDPTSQIPITNGFEFSRLCGHWPLLAFEVAMAIARISGQSEVDPRFFAWLSTSLAMPGTPRGTAARAESGRGRKGTAASRTRKDARQQTT